MAIRTDGLQWLKSNYGKVVGPVYVSKYYQPEESWTKSRVWWFEIPKDAIQNNQSENLHLLCQTGSSKSTFHYLRVPTTFFQKQEGGLVLRSNNRISMFLSADANDLFTDKRGTGDISFNKFVVFKSAQ